MFMNQQRMKVCDLLLLSLCVHLQINSADCLRLTQQQLLGVLHSPHHFLYKHTHTFLYT